MYMPLIKLHLFNATTTAYKVKNKYGTRRATNTSVKIVLMVCKAVYII